LPARTSKRPRRAVEYALTEFGASLVEALRPLCEWGRERMARIERTKAEAG
jgi:DNA-binding HxlR family transcriptional regulator